MTTELIHDALTSRGPHQILRDLLQAATSVLAVAPLGVVEPLLTPDLGPKVALISCSDLTAATLARLRPDLVLAPLFAPDFDILDVGARLMAMKFTGQLLALAHALPNAAAVAAELRSEFATFEVALVALGSPPAVRT